MSQSISLPSETFIGTNGKVIRKIQHGIVKTQETDTLLNSVIEIDPRILMIQLKDLERKKKAEEREIENRKKAEERGVERMINAEELKRQKSRNATNKLLDEIGLDPRYRLK